jgi:hypothetical protein
MIARHTSLLDAGERLLERRQPRDDEVQVLEAEPRARGGRVREQRHREVVRAAAHRERRVAVRADDGRGEVGELLARVRA